METNLLVSYKIIDFKHIKILRKNYNNFKNLRN